MKAPRRYLDDPDAADELRALLAEGAGPPPAMPPEVHAAIGKRVAAMGAGVGAGTLLLKLSAALLIVGASGAAIVALRPPASSPPDGAAASGSAVASGSANGPGPGPVAEPVTSVEATVPAPPVAEPVPPQPSTAARPEAAPRTTRGLGDARVMARPTPESDANDLLREAALLERARADLSTSPRRALTVARSHHRLFPNGQLGAERELIVSEALIELGRFREARRRLTLLSESGLYAEHARRLLARMEASAP